MSRVRALDQTLMMLQDCLCSAITEAAAQEGSMVQQVCMCSIVAGDSTPALDYCGPDSCSGDRCGMAWVRLASVIAGEGQAGIPGCAQPLQAQIEVGIARCAVTMVDDGMNLPTTEDYLRESLILLDDLKVMRQAVGCCDGVRTQILEYSPFGPQGGCVGGAFMIVADVL